MIEKMKKYKMILFLIFLIILPVILSFFEYITRGGFNCILNKNLLQYLNKTFKIMYNNINYYIALTASVVAVRTYQNNLKKDSEIKEKEYNSQLNIYRPHFMIENGSLIMKIKENNRLFNTVLVHSRGGENYASKELGTICEGCIDLGVELDLLDSIIFIFCQTEAGEWILFFSFYEFYSDHRKFIHNDFSRFNHSVSYKCMPSANKEINDKYRNIIMKEFEIASVQLLINNPIKYLEFSDLISAVNIVSFTKTLYLILSNRCHILKKEQFINIFDLLEKYFKNMYNFHYNNYNFSENIEIFRRFTSLIKKANFLIDYNILEIRTLEELVIKTKEIVGHDYFYSIGIYKNLRIQLYNFLYIIIVMLQHINYSYDLNVSPQFESEEFHILKLKILKLLNFKE